MEDRREKMQQKILVTRSSMPELEEYVEEIRDIWKTQAASERAERLS